MEVPLAGKVLNAGPVSKSETGMTAVGFVLFAKATPAPGSDKVSASTGSVAARLVPNSPEVGSGVG